MVVCVLLGRAAELELGERITGTVDNLGVRLCLLETLRTERAVELLTDLHGGGAQKG